jgi:outer membrane receptor protein involved in Fe transport
MKKTPINLRRALATVAILTPAAVAQAQSGGEASEDDVYVLPPFEVSTSNLGYSAETTLAGNRLATELRDIGSAVTVVTKEFMNDVGATNNTTLLQYTTGTEVGGIRGNFSGAGDAAILNEDTIRPNQNTRVRGLAAADNTRDFFRTDVPWDGYNVDRIDLQRGANSILFGQGSPAGIINASLKNAMFSDFGSVEARVASHGTIRGTVDVNRELIDGELAVRVAGLYQHEKFQQEPAFSKDKRVYAACATSRSSCA